MEDSHCKGYIDLGEVVSVTQATPTPGPPKKTDDKSFFDVSFLFNSFLKLVIINLMYLDQ